jgi:S1-C subfamily serine protease
MKLQTKTKTALLWASGTLAASLLAAGCGRIVPGSAPSSGSASVNAALTAPSVPATSGSSGTNFVRATAAKVEPSVVTVHTLAAIQRQPMSLQDLTFGRGGTEVRRGAGSGVIISSDGYILTNNHVVAGAQRVTVQVGDTGYEARVIGADTLTDIAVVKVTPPAGTTLPVAQLGDSDRVQVGDWAIAVGDPLDIGATVTFGIISAIGERGPHLQGDAASTVLQTDAAINPGNSGGALANSDGQVIGINEAIASPTGSSIGIGFAIPINAARKVAQQLIANGRVIRPFLGISYLPIQSIPPQARAQAGIDPALTTGVVIARVARDTPATSLLRPGDVIVSADGKPLEGKDTLNKIIGAHQIGDTLNLQVKRGSQTVQVPITLQERPASFGIPSPGMQP